MKRDADDFRSYGRVLGMMMMFVSSSSQNEAVTFRLRIYYVTCIVSVSMTGKRRFHDVTKNKHAARLHLRTRFDDMQRGKKKCNQNLVVPIDQVELQGIGSWRETSKDWLQLHFYYCDYFFIICQNTSGVPVTSKKTLHLVKGIREKEK